MNFSINWEFVRIFPVYWKNYFFHELFYGIFSSFFWLCIVSCSKQDASFPWKHANYEGSFQFCWHKKGPGHLHCALNSKKEFFLRKLFFSKVKIKVYICLILRKSQQILNVVHQLFVKTVQYYIIFYCSIFPFFVHWVYKVCILYLVPNSGSF